MQHIPYNAIQTGDDRGKKVLVRSVGGALMNVHGKVTFGPYTFDITYIKKEKKTNRKREYTVTSLPYWQVLLDGYNLDIGFINKELTFL